MFDVHWQRYPFLRILPTFLGGIYIGSHIRELPFQILMVVIILALSMVIYKKTNLKLKSLLLHITLFFCGCFLIMSNAIKTPQLPKKNQTILTTIIDELEEKEKTYKTVAKIQYINKQQKYLATKSILYLQKSDETRHLKIGDKLLLKGWFQEIEAPKLPGDFNYKKFLANKNIYFSAYVKSTDINLLNYVDKTMFIQRYASNKRQHFSKTIENNIESEYQGLIKAISLGQKTDLEANTKNAFAKAGIMHILAVSGLHVGIVWTLIAFIFNPIRKWNPKLKATTILIEVICIWLFAILTGFAPSVQRAAFMFTLLSISKINQFEKDSVNLVVSSAIMLLIFNPKLLFEVGFQLSYSAVLGIILLYPKIYPLLFFSNKFADNIWKLEVVSLAAVIGTAPISIFYFHQFSLIFPVTNIIAIPAAYLLVTGSILLFISSGLYWLGSIIGFCLSKICWILTASIKCISNYTFSAIPNLYINTLEFLILSIFIFTIGLILYEVKQKKQALIVSILVLNVLFVYRGTRKINRYQNIDYFSISHQKNKTQLVTIGNKLIVVVDENIDHKYPIQLNGLKKNQLLYKKEVINSRAFNFSDFIQTTEINAKYD